MTNSDRRNYMIVLTGLLFLIFSAQAQDSTGLVGKWKFKDIFHPATSDMKSLEMIRYTFADMFYFLRPDKKYSGIFFSKETGTWEYDTVGKKLTLINEKGGITRFFLLGVSDSSLILSLGKGKEFYFRREAVEPNDTVASKPLTISPVNVSMRQITKKWYFREVYGSDTPFENRFITDLFHGNYIFFKPDFTCESKIGFAITNDKWAFGDENKSIIVTDNKESKTWRIQAVNDTALILVDKQNALWRYSIK